MLGRRRRCWRDALPAAAAATGCRGCDGSPRAAGHAAARPGSPCSRDVTKGRACAPWNLRRFAAPPPALSLWRDVRAEAGRGRGEALGLRGWGRPGSGPGEQVRGRPARPGPALPVSGWEEVRLAAAAPRGGEGRSRRSAGAEAWGRGVATRVTRFFLPVTFGRCGSRRHRLLLAGASRAFCCRSALLQVWSPARPPGRVRCRGPAPREPLVPGWAVERPPPPRSVRLGPTGDSPRPWGSRRWPGRGGAKSWQRPRRA